MTGYGKCCGRRIVAMNWNFCPFCGEDLIAGFKVPLRAKIAEAQTTMSDHLDRLDGKVKASMNWTMKKLRLAATSSQLAGRSKMSKPELVEALTSDSEALYDF